MSSCVIIWTKDLSTKQSANLQASIIESICIILYYRIVLIVIVRNFKIYALFNHLLVSSYFFGLRIGCRTRVFSFAVCV